MDNRLKRLENLIGFTDKEKEIYKYTLTKYLQHTGVGDIYHYDKELDFDFVQPTDASILQDASEKFNLPIEEIDKIVIKIESEIFN